MLPPRPRPRPHLGWLGPVIVGVGAAVAAVGVWYMVHARPVAGDVLDTVAIEGPRALVVRGEVGGDRAFLELRDGETVVWQALVPRYGGRPGAPGVAWSPSAVSIRVVRNQRAELFALAMADAHKLGGMVLAPNHGPIAEPATGPVTLTDHVRTYEVVSGPDWHQLVAIDLASGRALWARDLGPAPVVAGGVSDSRVWIDQGAGPHGFAVLTGEDQAVRAAPGQTRSSL